LDDNQELVASLGIRSIPCLLLFQDGEVVERVVGARHRGFFSELLDKYVQRPVDVLLSEEQKTYRAFHGDPALRSVVAKRVQSHISAGHIVPGGRGLPVSNVALQQFSLMGAAAETANVSEFEERLGIPGAVGKLQEAVHSPLIEISPSPDASAKASATNFSCR